VKSLLFKRGANSPKNNPLETNSLSGTPQHNITLVCRRTSISSETEVILVDGWFSSGHPPRTNIMLDLLRLETSPHATCQAIFPNSHQPEGFRSFGNRELRHQRSHPSRRNTTNSSRTISSSTARLTPCSYKSQRQFRHEVQFLTTPRDLAIKSLLRPQDLTTPIHPP
jgi:hypothetical protein